MGEPAEKWNKSQRLAVAGLVAPHLRDQSDRTARRRVAVYDQGTGEVLRYTTLAEVQKGVLSTARIEFEVVEGTRPKEAICEECGRAFERKPKTRRMRCDKCTFLACADCGKQLPRNYSSPSMRRGPAETCCRPCRKLRNALIRSSCSDCGTQIPRNSEWQYRKTWGEEAPLRCGPCNREARRLPKPRCSGCEKELPRSVLSNARARSGKPPLCRPCYSGETRAAIAREKIASDLAFARKVRKAMSKGHARADRLRLPPKTCGGCDKRISRTSTMCRSCSQKYRHAVRPLSAETRERIAKKTKATWQSRRAPSQHKGGAE